MADLPDLSLNLTQEHVDFYDSEYPEKWNSTLDKLQTFSENLAPWNIHLTALKDEAQRQADNAKNAADTADTAATETATAIRVSLQQETDNSVTEAGNILRQVDAKLLEIQRHADLIASALAAIDMPVLSDADIGKNLIWGVQGYEAKTDASLVGGGTY